MKKKTGKNSFKGTLLVKAMGKIKRKFAFVHGKIHILRSLYVQIKNEMKIKRKYNITKTVLVIFNEISLKFFV